MNVLKYPDLLSAQETLNQSIKEPTFIIIIGNCAIDYSGRAQSKLGYGDRVILIKPDKTLLIHRVKGARPVNWQPAGTILTFNIDGDVLQLRGVRSSPRELMKVGFSKIDLIITKKMKDTAEFDLNATEFDMHQAIMDNPELFEPGFKPIAREKKVPTGFIDIYGRDRDGRDVIIEVKKNPVGVEDLNQLRAYVQDLKNQYPNRIFRGVILGPSLTKVAKVEMVKPNTIPVEFGKLTIEKCLRVKKPPKVKRLSEFF